MDGIHESWWIWDACCGCQAKPIRFSEAGLDGSVYLDVVAIENEGLLAGSSQDLNPPLASQGKRPDFCATIWQFPSLVGTGQFGHDQVHTRRQLKNNLISREVAHKR